MSTLEGECVALLLLHGFIRFFYTDVVAIICLLVIHVNKPIIFVFGASVYCFKNTISILVTLPPT